MLYQSVLVHPFRSNGSVRYSVFVCNILYFNLIYIHIFSILYMFDTTFIEPLPQIEENQIIKIIWI